jgi:hypothetical protein
VPLVKYEIVELDELSGERARIYSVVPKGESEDLFTQFVGRWRTTLGDEVKDIVGRLWEIGNRRGARADYFRHDEGRPGDGMCAFYDRPGAKLRLYCLRYGSVTLILGSGGPKNVRAWQDDPILKREAERMIKYGQDINLRLRDGDGLYWSSDQTEILGDLKNYEDEDDDA